MTESTESTLLAPDVMTDTRAPADLRASPDLPNLGYSGLGDGVEETREPSLQTFDKMLPAARAFYRRPSSS